MFQRIYARDPAYRAPPVSTGGRFFLLSEFSVKNLNNTDPEDNVLRVFAFVREENEILKTLVLSDNFMHSSSEFVHSTLGERNDSDTCNGWSARRG